MDLIVRLSSVWERSNQTPDENSAEAPTRQTFLHVFDQKSRVNQSPQGKSKITGKRDIALLLQIKTKTLEANVCERKS